MIDWSIMNESESGTEQSLFWSVTKNFFPCNHFFSKKDVAESLEARKVTQSL